VTGTEPPGGDFEDVVRSHEAMLRAHCYRMLGSPEDADDALQETMLAAWRGRSGFRGDSSVRTWLYRIATNCCLRLAEKRGPRTLSWDHGPSLDPHADLGAPDLERRWVEPFPTRPVDPRSMSDPVERSEHLEAVELAWVAALQHLPPSQRAVLVLREVLAFSAAEVGQVLDLTVPAVNSALQRARATLARAGLADPADVPRLPAGRDGVLVREFMRAWESSDVDALVGLLADDVRLTMPPLTAWFAGVADVGAFIRDRMLRQPWRLLPVELNDQAAFACYQRADGRFRYSGATVLTIRDSRVTWVASFLDPRFLDRLDGCPEFLDADR
jgi:RNA polymerase sigma-70 factor (TIGR02960 family)